MVAVLLVITAWFVRGPDSRCDIMAAAFLLIPASLLLGFWFSRPVTMYIDTKHHWFVTGDRRVYIPYSRGTVEVRSSKTSADYSLYVTDMDTKWEGVFWRSFDEAEISAVVSELRARGIQVNDQTEK